MFSAQEYGQQELSGKSRTSNSVSLLLVLYPICRFRVANQRLRVEGTGTGMRCYHHLSVSQAISESLARTLQAAGMLYDSCSTAGEL
ncbi:MAG: hypothetical protein M1399_01995 [Actinobacteria bacterium]|nr:hypothetical protein [Actinomycetota bacterium]